MIKDISRDEYLFSEEEYDILSKDTCKLTNEDNHARNMRLSIQRKLLDLNSQILPMIKEHKLDIHNHRIPRNVTSQPYPNPRNYWSVDWICVRYGRDARDIRLLNLDAIPGEDEEFGFLKFQCMQVTVVEQGVEVVLFHSIPTNSFDRGYVHNNIDNEEYRQKLIELVKKLQGYGFVWYAGDDKFEFDTHKSEEFIDFYKNSDRYHTYSYLCKQIPRWDERLLKKNIAQASFEIMDQMYELFQHMKWPMNGGTI